MVGLAIAWKDIRILLNERGRVFMLFLLPVIFVVAFTAIFDLQREQTPEAIELIVANGDPGGAMSVTLLQELGVNGGVTAKPVPTEEGLSQLRSEQIDVLLVIPAGFSTDISSGTPVLLRLVSGPEADSSRLEALRSAVDGVAKDLSLETQLVSALELMGDMMGTNPESNRVFTPDRVVAQARSQFERARSEPLISIERSIPDEILRERASFSPADLSVPGFTVLFVFLAAVGTAVSLFEERTTGTFRRLLISPVGKVQIVFGKLLPNMATALLQIFIIFGVSMALLPLLGFQGISMTRPGVLLVISVLVALCSSALGLLIASIARTEGQISSMGAVILWAMGAVSGAFVPQFFLGGFLGSVGKIVPHYWATAAYQGVLVRGQGLSGITQELGMLIGFTALFFGFGLWRFRFGVEGAGGKGRLS